jgi:hypothetical protein
MFDHRRYILPTLPLSISEIEKFGKPKEEIRNLKMDLNIFILMISKYNICKLNICILVILRYNISNLNILRIHISYFRGHNNGGNFASIEVAIAEARPPLVWDVQAETYQCLHPFQVDGDMLDDGARHCKRKGM